MVFNGMKKIRLRGPHLLGMSDLVITIYRHSKLEIRRKTNELEAVRTMIGIYQNQK